MSWYNNEMTEKLTQSKYLHKGEKNYEDLVERVSSIYSNKEKAKKAMLDGDIMPAGRTLYGAGKKGKKRLTLSNCFLKGAKVLTAEGFKNIEDVSKGDFVVTSCGLHKVNATMCREYTGEIISIKAKTLLDTIKCTPNHKFLTKNGWESAEDISNSKSTTYLLNTKHSMCKSYSSVDILDGFIPREGQEILEDGGKVYIRTKFIGGNGAKGYKDSNKVNRFIKFTPEFLYFIGRYIGDGSVTKYSGRHGGVHHSILQIVFNAEKEEDEANRIIEIGTNAFGVKPNVRYTEQTVIAVRWESPIISEWFYNNFGKYCDGKYIPNKFLGDMNIAKGLMCSDGSVNQDGGFSITLKNFEIIEWLNDTLFMNGINTLGIKKHLTQDKTFVLNVPAQISRKYILPWYKREYSDNRLSLPPNDLANYTMIMSTSKEEYSGIVYNLSVEGLHEYNINGVICHNCYILPSPEDNLKSISDVDYYMSKIGSMGGGVGFCLDKIRPKGSKINNSAGTADGVAFCMRKYNETSKQIGQNQRRMALMCALSCSHPDIYEFLRLKQNEEKLEMMNISIKFDDEFMQAVEEDKEYTLSFQTPHEKIEKKIRAREFFKEYCEVNKDWGDPK